MGDGYVRYSSPPVGSIHQQAEGHGQQHHPQASHASTSAYAPAGGSDAHARGYGQGGPHAPMGYGQPAGFGWPGVNDATAQMGMQFGKSAVAAGQDYVEKNVSWRW